MNVTKWIGHGYPMMVCYTTLCSIMNQHYCYTPTNKDLRGYYRSYQIVDYLAWVKKVCGAEYFHSFKGIAMKPGTHDQHQE